MSGGKLFGENDMEVLCEVTGVMVEGELDAEREEWMLKGAAAAARADGREFLGIEVSGDMMVWCCTERLRDPDTPCSGPVNLEGT